VASAQTAQEWRDVVGISEIVENEDIVEEGPGKTTGLLVD
jgi:hypothetical protein